MSKTIKDLQTVVVLAVCFVVPLIFLPLFPNILITPKLLVLVGAVVLLLLLFLAQTILDKKLEIDTGPYDVPFLVLLLTTLVSGLLRSPNKAEAFWLPGTATILIAGLAFYFLVNQLTVKIKRQIPLALYLTAIIVSLLSLLTVGKVLNGLPLPAYLKDPTFTTVGGNLAAFIFLVALVPTGLALATSAKETFKRVGCYLGLLIITLGAAGNLYNILPGRTTAPQTLPTAIAWSVAIDTLKESPLLGNGPGNYLTAFNRFRPLSYNQTTNWDKRFSAANSSYLTLMTELGLLGTAAVIVFLFLVVSKTRQELALRREMAWGFSLDPNTFSLSLAVVLLALANASLPMWLVFFAFAAVSSETKKHAYNLSGYLPAFLISLPFLILVAGLLFLSYKSVRAEVTYNRVLTAINRNNGGRAYELINQAIQQNSRVDRYHITAAQINFALANSMAQKPAGEKLSDQERQTVSQLIQQSIAEGKAAVALNPQRASNWGLLANLYRSIMAFAQGSDQFAIQSFNQAIALDPFDPGLRLSLGGIYYALGDYDSAIDVLKTAVLVKADYANTRYNLAVAYREKGELAKAVAEMTNVLSLVDRNSQDYETAKKELEALEAKLPKKETTTSEEGQPETLATPAPTAEPVVSPPIELPAEAQPPEVSPEPTPTIEP